MSFQYRTCNQCGWVHFGVTRDDAESQVVLFNTYFNKLSAEQQNEMYGGKPASIGLYESCQRCGNSCKEFRESKQGDCPDGSTIGPIICEESES